MHPRPVVFQEGKDSGNIMCSQICALQLWAMATSWVAQPHGDTDGQLQYAYYM